MLKETLLSNKLNNPVFAKSVVGLTGKSTGAFNNLPLNFPESIRNGVIEKKCKKSEQEVKRMCCSFQPLGGSYIHLEVRIYLLHI